MSVDVKHSSDAPRPADWVSKDAYLSEDFARLEADRLWPRIWQVACREEEIPNVGDFVTYDVGDDSLTVIRASETEIKAFHNVCMHRGRRLTEGCGSVSQFVCRYHGWRWNLEGENTHVVDRHDWGERLKDAEIRLKPAKVGTWRGFVFINMDLDAEPLADFLGPIEERCGRYEYDKMRFSWYKTVVLPCNWKVVIEGFNEGYHVQQTHRQLIEWMDDYTASEVHGQHSAFWYPPFPPGMTRFGPARRLERQGPIDYRKVLLAYLDEMHHELGAIITPRAHAAAQALLDLPEDTPGPTVVATYGKLVRDAAIADGAGWPDITPDYVVLGRVDWHVFPNFVFLPSTPDGLLAYRARPGPTPDTCVFDVWALMRYAPGKEPPIKREFVENMRDPSWGRILSQDFSNFGDVQRGMKSRALEGLRTNPVQELAVWNLHRALHAFLSEDVAAPDGSGQGGTCKVEQAAEPT